MYIFWQFGEVTMLIVKAMIIVLVYKVHIYKRENHEKCEKMHNE